MADCLHDSMSGDEGPVRELGRMPIRWRCDQCDAVVYDEDNTLYPIADDDPINQPPSRIYEPDWLT